MTGSVFKLGSTVDNKGIVRDANQLGNADGASTVPLVPPPVTLLNDLHAEDKSEC